MAVDRGGVPLDRVLDEGDWPFNPQKFQKLAEPAARPACRRYARQSDRSPGFGHHALVGEPH